jgi:hypothetical protein
LAIRAKIEESACAVFCIQETKREEITLAFMKKVSPKRFRKFVFSPSRGASSGILLGWNPFVFTGQVLEINSFFVTVLFRSTHSGEKWKLSTVYGPCTGEQRNLFVDWLNNLPIDPDENWMIIGDFNFYRSGEDRKRPGGNVADMNIFNGIISNLGIWKSLSKAGVSLGATCTKIHCWNSWIGVSPLSTGPLIFQIPYCFPYPNQLQTICHVWFKLAQRYPRLMSFGLKTYGFNIQVFLR